jgi:diguanylate cyclase (GGDEF)-like protein
MMPRRGRFGAHPRRFALGLQAKILVLASACVMLPLLGMGAYLLHQNERMLGEQARAGLVSDVSRRAERLDAWILQRMQEVHSWSLSFVVYETVETTVGRTAGAERAGEELRAYLASVLKHHGEFESLFVADLDGRVLASTRPETLERGWEGDVAPGRRGGVTRVRPSTALGRPTLLVAHGIAGRSGRAIAWLFARVDLAAVDALLCCSDGDGDTTFWLLDPEGHIVAERGRIVSDPGRRPFPVPLAGAAPVSAAEAVLTTGRVLYASDSLKGALEGRLVATVDAAVAYLPVVRSRQRLLGAGAALMLVVLAANIAASRRLLRSLHRLAEGAREMSAGHLDVELPVQGSDEVFELTVSFNEMARRVREAHDHLAWANTGLLAANRSLAQLSITDGLTGLYNHRHFYETLARELQRSERERAPLSLLLLDLDHFKQYNDRYGHTEGDAALRMFARQLLASIRSSDSAFRYGGEELAVLLPACPAEQALEVGEKVRAAVEAAGRRSGNHPVTTSVGVASYPDHAGTAQDLVTSADTALYDAKRDGRNRVVAAQSQPGVKRGVVGVIDPSRARASRH